MRSTFGRVEPPARNRERDGPSADPPVSPAVIRQLHEDLIRQKRRSLMNACYRWSLRRHSSGVVAFLFIDNAAHVGGFATGAALGLVLPQKRTMSAVGNALDVAGWIALIVLLAGAGFTAVRLAR